MDKLIDILTDEEKNVLNRIGIKSDDLADIEEQIADYLQLHCIDSTGNELTEEGIICEDILNKIGNLE